MRLVTWNTWWCFGPWEERQPLLASVLKRLGPPPDVVLLQESWPEQAAELASACDLKVMDWVGGSWAESIHRKIDIDQVFGNAILADPTTTELLGSIRLDTSDDDPAPRSGIAVRHRGDDGSSWTIVNTHLCSRLKAGATRSVQMDELRRWVDGLTADRPDERVVLGGDLNQVPSSDEYDAAIAPHWTDLWAMARPGDNGGTMVPENPRLRAVDWMDSRNPPGTPPGVRFDYLLGRGASFRTDRIEQIGGADDGWPSDHLGLVADLAAD